MDIFLIAILIRQKRFFFAVKTLAVVVVVVVVVLTKLTLWADSVKLDIDNRPSTN